MVNNNVVLFHLKLMRKEERQNLINESFMSHTNKIIAYYKKKTLTVVWIDESGGKIELFYGIKGNRI